MGIIRLPTPKQKPQLPAEEPDTFNQPIDFSNGVGSLCRWLGRSSNMTYHENAEAFASYDQIHGRVADEVAKFPVLLLHLKKTSEKRQNSAIDFEKLITNILRKSALDNVDRTQTKIARAVRDYRPDLEELDGLPVYLKGILDSGDRLPPGFAKISVKPKNRVAMIATLEQLSVDARAIIDEIVPANMKLVISMSNQYTNRGLSQEDLISEGGIGLHKAAQRFEVSRGNLFSTYASWWIRQSMTRAIIDCSRDVRIPVHMSDFIQKVTRTEQSLSHELERPPTAEEIADEIEADPKRVAKALSYRTSMVSLHTPIGDEGDSKLEDFIVDHSAKDPSLEASKSEETLGVAKLLSTLSEREREVIRCRFGLEGQAEHTLEQLGERFGVTRERVRQIEAKALRRLRFRVKDPKKLLLRD